MKYQRRADDTAGNDYIQHALHQQVSCEGVGVKQNDGATGLR